MLFTKLSNEGCMIVLDGENTKRLGNILNKYKELWIDKHGRTGWQVVKPDTMLYQLMEGLGKTP